MPDAAMTTPHHTAADVADDPTQPLESAHPQGRTPWARRAIKQSLFAVGYYHQRLLNAAFPGVAVLCYHGVRTSDDAIPFSDLHVTTTTFERHCRLIADTCDPISLSELRDARRGRELPSRSVLVTFDDGYRGVLDHALPILERYAIPAAVFVSAAPVLEGRHCL